MPELPETEVITRELRECCLGASVERIEILHPEILDKQSDLKPAWYEKAIIERVERHGKHILLTVTKVQETRYLGIRLGMSGQLIRHGLDTSRAAHTHAVISFVDRPFELHFRDPRRFGRIALVSSPVSSQKGVDPLGLRTATFVRVMGCRRGRIKAALMNQSILAGIGNIYANEILFESGLHPHQKVDRLAPGRLQGLLLGIKKVLQRGIRNGGTTIRDFRSLYGIPGRFQHFLKVYGKSKNRCPRPGCTGTIRLLRSTPQAQPSFFCPRCQRKT